MSAGVVLKPQVRGELNSPESTDARRRAYNQAWFEGLYLDSVVHEVLIARAERTEAFEALRTAERASQQPVTGMKNPEDDERRGSMRYRVISRVGVRTLRLWWS